MILNNDRLVHVLAAVNHSEDDCSLLGPIINDIKGVLRSMEGTSLNFVHRKANNVAHMLILA